MRKHLLAWLLVPVMAMLNGFLREFVYAGWMSRTMAHSISVFPLVLAILLWAAWVGRRWPLPNDRSAVRVGIVWLALTIAFELGLGALRGVPLDAMLREYDITRGNLWPVVPLTMGFAPILVRRIRFAPAQAVRFVLGGLLAFGALNAFAGGYYGLSGAKGVPLEWLEGSPFRDYTIPSLFLFFVLGGSFALAAFAVFAKRPSASRLAQRAAILVVLWVAVQVAVIGFVSWMQPATTIAGILMLALTRWLPSGTTDGSTPTHEDHPRSAHSRDLGMHGRRSSP